MTLTMLRATREGLALLLLGLLAGCVTAQTGAP